MASQRAGTSRPRVVADIASVGSRAAAVTLRPFTGAMTAATNAGIAVERRTLDRVLDSGELERALMTILGSPRLQDTLRRAMASEGVGKLVDSFFDSGLFDRFADRLLASDGLWRLIDEIAASPAVTAAISQQGLGFADQVGNELRVRSRKGDALVERVAQRIVNRRGDTG
jgi:hypothetical protein